MATAALRANNPIIAGYEWRELVTITGASSPVVPSGSTFRGAARIKPEAPPVLSLSTADGSIVRNDDYSLYVIIPAAVSNQWPPREYVYIDIVRTDVSPEQHMGFALMVEVSSAVTLPI